MTTKEMTRAVGDAVAAYRKLVQHEFDVSQENDELNRRVEALSIFEVEAYVEATKAIDAAADRALTDIDAGRFSSSTAKQRFRQETNRAGRG
jgi:hypothetical protein